MCDVSYAYFDVKCPEWTNRDPSKIAIFTFLLSRFPWCVGIGFSLETVEENKNQKNNAPFIFQMFFWKLQKIIKKNGNWNLSNLKICKKNRVFDLRFGTWTIGFAQHVLGTSNPDPCWMCSPSGKMHITATPSDIHEPTSIWATNPKMCVCRPPGAFPKTCHITAAESPLSTNN